MRPLEDIVQGLDVVRSLPYIHGPVECVSRNVGGEGGGILLNFHIRVDIPAKGPVCDIRPIEPVAILLSPRLPPRVFLLRDSFPAVPHFSQQLGEKYGEICLTRRPIADWWHGKTLEDVVLATYRWLLDAAAGELVKSDDPLEPLIVNGRNPVVEVDFEAARRKASKTGGVWDTTAFEIAVPHQTAVRLVVGAGEVPTLLWYQPSVQPKPWITAPVNLDEVIELAATAGMERRKVRYWIDKWRAKRDRVLTVIGVKRPKEVLGRAEAEEWIAFDFHRSRGREEWTLTSHLVLRRFDRGLARQVSGFGEAREPKNVLVVGAGALGATVCDLLARSGLTHLTIVDGEVLRPHNLARHILTEREVGHAKALAVAERCNGIFADEPVAEGKVVNILDLTEQELNALIGGMDCAVDCSASVAVQHRLAALPGRDVPLVCAFQILAGEGTIVLAEDSDRHGRSDAIEAALMARERNNPFIARWFTEKTSPLALGGGCSSVSARIPDTRVKIGAAWVADAVIRWLTANEWPGKPMYGIQQNSAAPNPTTTTEWKSVEVEQVVETAGGWHAHVLTSVIDDMNRLAKRAQATETGGILVGRVNRQTRTFYVCEAWSAPPDSDASAVGFTRGRKGLASKLAILEADSGENLTYVGEWHAHPPSSKTSMSARDSETARLMAEKLSRDRIPALCVITDRCHHDVHVVEAKREQSS